MKLYCSLLCYMTKHFINFYSKVTSSKHNRACKEIFNLTENCIFSKEVKLCVVAKTFMQYKLDEELPSSL